MKEGLIRISKFAIYLVHPLIRAREFKAIKSVGKKYDEKYCFKLIAGAEAKIVFFTRHHASSKEVFFNIHGIAKCKSDLQIDMKT